MRRFLSLLAVASIAACGGAAKQEAPPAPPPEPATTTPRLSELDALEHDLAVAEQRLNVQVERKLAVVTESSRAEDDGEATGSDEPLGEAGPGRGGTAQRPAETPAPPPADPEARFRDAERSTPCDVACRALASMKRSAEKICELAGAEDSRCVRARARVSGAGERVARAGCACREP